jgi:hypothetical protein
VEQVCLVIPVHPGRSSDAREFMRELEASRKDEYARSEERIGITKEVWFLAGVGGGDAMIAYIETHDFAHAWDCSHSRRTSSTCGSSGAWPRPPAWISTIRPK